MEITIKVEPETLEIDDVLRAEIERAMGLMGELYDAADCEVSINLTDDEHIHELNKKYRGIDRPTDVLSFALRESDEPEIIFDADESQADVLGDIVVSVERARSQALEYGHSFRRELIFLIVHGMLHLLGYDHVEEADRLEMEAEQKFVMSELSIGRED